MVEDLLELTLAHSVPVEDDPLGLKARALVELNEHLPDHGGQLSYDLLAVLLDPHRGTVATGVGVHAGHKLQMVEWEGGVGGWSGRVEWEGGVGRWSGKVEWEGDEGTV